MIPHSLLGMPWAILPTAAQQMLSMPHQAANDKVGHPALSQVFMVGSTAVLPISGVIAKGCGPIDECYYDMCDLRRIDQQLDNILMDSGVRNVVLSIDSPGGATIGVETTARKVRELVDAGKNVVAYTDTVLASAAYFIAAGARIVANPTAIVGSISTLTVAYDYSKMLQDDGVEVKVFRTGELKGAGTFGKPWTPEEEAAVERRMMFIDGLFKSHVKKYRGLTDDDMQGDFWYAANAPRGAVDALADSLEDLILSL